MNHSRPLTHDEKKAAEAAYRGRTFDASWSQSARAVYDGILKARGYAADAFDSNRDNRKPAKEFEPSEIMQSASSPSETEDNPSFPLDSL